MGQGAVAHMQNMGGSGVPHVRNVGESGAQKDVLRSLLNRPIQTLAADAQTLTGQKVLDRITGLRGG
eukprot:1158864-Pelagomonas_calceolata.AAC.3